MRILVDVDGVVADLMGAFIEFAAIKGCIIRMQDITAHTISKSKELKHLSTTFDLDDMLREFLSIDNCYDAVMEIEGSSKTLKALSKRHDLVFLTATMKSAPQSYASKFNWLQRRFPKIPVLTAPSEYKHWVAGDILIDDRYDACSRFSAAWPNGRIGASFLFGQPWNEAPESVPRHDWKTILECLDE